MRVLSGMLLLVIFISNLLDRFLELELDSNKINKVLAILWGICVFIISYLSPCYLGECFNLNISTIIIASIAQMFIAYYWLKIGDILKDKIFLYLVYIIPTTSLVLLSLILFYIVFSIA